MCPQCGCRGGSTQKPKLVSVRSREHPTFLSRAVAPPCRLTGETALCPGGRFRVQEELVLTDTVCRGPTPGEVRKAGPGGGALKQVAFVTLEEHRAPNLGQRNRPVAPALS